MNIFELLSFVIVIKKITITLRNDINSKKILLSILYYHYQNIILLSNLRWFLAIMVNDIVFLV